MASTGIPNNHRLHQTNSTISLSNAPNESPLLASYPNSDNEISLPEHSFILSQTCRASTNTSPLSSQKMFASEFIYSNSNDFNLASTSFRRESSDLSSVESPPPLPKQSFLLTVQTVLRNGVGFAVDAYDLFVMSTVLVVLGFDHHKSTSDESLLATAVLVGSVIGQLVFGVLSDKFGRKKLFVATLSILIFGAIMSSASSNIGEMGIFQMLALCRFVLGIGIGGEYPLSATVSAESLSDHPIQVGPSRGQRIARTFAMQGLGMIAAPLIVLLLLAIMPNNNFSVVWRGSLAVGALPGLAMLYSRIKMKETDAFSQLQPQTSSEKFIELKKHSKDLLSASMSWLIFDVVFYAQSLYSAQTLKKFINKPSESDIKAINGYLITVTSHSLLLAVLSLPGYIVAAMLIDRWGRRRLQMIGFISMFLCYLLLAVTFQKTVQSPGAFFFLYSLSFFFANFANTATFVIPAELFPVSIRSTAHGICAASGKIGAALGTSVFPFINERYNTEVVLFVSSGVSVIGLIWTYFLTRETKSLTFENEVQVEDKVLAEKHRRHSHSINQPQHMLNFHSSHSQYPKPELHQATIDLPLIERNEQHQ